MSQHFYFFVVFSYLCSHLRALDKDSRPNVILVSYSWSYLVHSVFIFMQKTPLQACPHKQSLQSMCRKSGKPISNESAAMSPHPT